MKKLLSCLLMVILAFSAFSISSAEDITYTGKITGGKLHMRAEPASNAKIVSTYKAGQEVEVLENDGTWCKVRKGSKEGYMMAEYLTITANYTHLAWAKTKPDGSILSLREKPDTESNITAQFMSGAACEIIEKEKDFCRVRIGSRVGYVPADLLTEINGEFSPDFSAAASDGFSIAVLKNGKREFGNPKSMERESDEFSYNLHYPVLNIADADSKISLFLNSTLALFDEDYTMNHPGEKGRYTVEYLAQDVDGQYQSVVLAGEYRAGNTLLHVFLTLNLDVESKTMVDLSSFFPDSTRLNYAMEGQLSGLMPVPTDGYAGAADPALLDHGVLTKDGLDIYLPAGLYLPCGLGSRKITLPYAQIAETMQIDSDYIKSHKRTIDPSKPMIALTFDDGPSEETSRILSVLAQYDARATFCVQGYKVEAFGPTVKRAIALGNEIASHTWSHPKLTEKSASVIRSQLERTNAAVRDLTGGYEIKVLRPPYGSYNKNVRNICKDLGMVIATWQVDTLDWSTRSASKTYQAIMKGAKTGGVIILCHDLYASTASAVEKAVPELVANGVQLVTVSELLSFHKDGIQPGTVYSRLDPKNIKQ